MRILIGDIYRLFSPVRPSKHNIFIHNSARNIHWLFFFLNLYIFWTIPWRFINQYNDVKIAFFWDRIRLKLHTVTKRTGVDALIHSHFYSYVLSLLRFSFTIPVFLNLQHNGNIPPTFFGQPEQISLTIFCNAWVQLCPFGLIYLELAFIYLNLSLGDSLLCCVCACVWSICVLFWVCGTFSQTLLDLLLCCFPLLWSHS